VRLPLEEGRPLRLLSHQSPVRNMGAEVTKGQQWRILLSTSLVAFTVIGFTQSFGVFQAHYSREQAVEEGVLRPKDIAERALISSIGSLGNGGLVAIFAVAYYPHLPRIGKSIRLLCFGGTALVGLGLGTAALSRNVSAMDPRGTLEFAHLDADLDTVRLPGSACRRWDRHFDQRPCSHPPRILPAPKWTRTGNHVCLCVSCSDVGAALLI